VADFSIEFTPAAARAFKKLNRDTQSRLAKTIDKLSSNPLPNGVKKLSGEENLYRIRVGDYRIVYQMKSKELIILVVRLGHRREVYDF
jgi:mRNA interferase RelE/StbE